MDLRRKDLIPSYGDLFTLKEFIQCCKQGSFIDYDGVGEYSDGEFIYPDYQVYPSDIINRDIKKEFSHVVWYNK